MADLKEINLKIKGSNRPATAWFDEQQRQYNAFVPAAKVVDGSGMGYENPSVQAHMSTFDENGDLVGVDAYGYGAEGGFYPTPWPTKQDSIYNANAAKQYAPQVFNQVKKKQIGGLMNYSQYLQQGGGIENQIAQLVQAALSGDQQANSQIEQIMQAAQKGDKQAQQIAQMIQQIAQQLQGEQGESAQTEAMKCGGKMRAKVKKAACGKKMEMGAEIKKSKKVCACQLKKVGGKLIEVDGCTGLPIVKEGTKIHYARNGENTGNWFTRLIDKFATASRAVGANYTPGAGSIAGSIVDGTPSGIVGSSAQQSTGYNGVENQNQRLTSQSEHFIDWLKENAPEYVGLKQRAALASRYGLGPANTYTGSLDQNMALWKKMKADKEAGMEFGGPSVAPKSEIQPLAVAPAPAASSIQISGPRQPTVDPNREAAIAAMSGRHISNRERQRYGAAYDAITSGANPAEMSQRQISDIQRMGRTYRPQTVAAKNGGSLTYAQFLGL